LEGGEDDLRESQSDVASFKQNEAIFALKSSFGQKQFKSKYVFDADIMFIVNPASVRFRADLIQYLCAAHGWYNTDFSYPITG
jgi:hypothetical protein